MLQTNRIPAIFQNRDENPPTYRHTPTFVKHSKRFYPSHPPPPHTSTSSTQPPSPQHTITPTHHHPNTLNRPTLSTRGEASPRAAIARRAIHRSPLCGRSIAAPATPWLTQPNPTLHHPIITTTSAPSAKTHNQLAKPNPTSSNHHHHKRPEGAQEHSPGSAKRNPGTQPRGAKTQPASIPSKSTNR